MRHLKWQFSYLVFTLLLMGSAFAQRGPALFQLSVSPSAFFLVPGHTFPLQAQRTFFTARPPRYSEDVTSKIAWKSLDQSLATISTAGLVTASSTKTGTVTLQATLGGLTATAQLTVSNTVMLNTITVTPATQIEILPPGGAVSYTAIGNYSDDSTPNITSSAAWSSSQTNVASMSANVATPAGPGATLISAALSGVTGTAQLQVVPKLVIAPPSAVVAFDQTQQFSADLPVTWSVDGITNGNATVGTISRAGLYAPSPSSVGTHTIGAASLVPAQQASVTVQVISGFKGVLTYHNDNARSGLNPNEVVLDPSNVNSSKFGLLFVLPADGLVDAQPLYVPNVAIPGKGTHNVVVVATEHDSVYLYDADSGAPYWQRSMLPVGETTSDDRSCSQVTPEIGITATPVIDLSRGPSGSIYVVAMSKNASGAYFQRLHALDLASGAEEFGGPAAITGIYPGTGDGSNGTDVIFDPSQYKERDGLLALNGKIYMAWASHCDITPYTGWVMAYDENTLAQSSVIDTTPNGSEGAYWNAGGGLAADSSGNIYQTVGNGDFDATLNPQGFPANGDYGNAFIKFSTASGLAVNDYFEMFNELSENQGDVDLGSAGAMLLPDMVDAQNRIRHLAIGAGKDTNIYLVDRDNMGKFNPNDNSQIYQELSGALSGGMFSSPAYFNGKVYFGAVGDPLRAFQFTQAVLSSGPVSISVQTFGYPGATPSISSAGDRNAILWATENSDPAVLHAYDANDLSNELYNNTQAGSRDNFGAGNKFIAPMIANGKVYVGTTNGVGVLGLF